MTSIVSLDRLLDLRGMLSGERETRVIASLDGLAPAEGLILVSGDVAGDLLRALQRKRRGLFEWSVLAAGPPVWRIELVRRAGALGEPRGVNEALSWDHDRLDAVEEEAFRLRESGDFVSAGERYAAFAAGLRRHIGFEEQVLFPAFENASGMTPTAGPTAVMRAEHREIESLLVAIEEGITDPAFPVETFRQQFRGVLGDHNLKEEEVLYPMSDNFLGVEGSDRLVEEIQRFGG
jgi:uncharacterized protein (DUF2249 family)/hemerythrin-like domain-containing protein